MATKSFISAAERALIKGCADNGVGIDYLGDHAPRFRFVPTEHGGDPYKGREDAKPSSRGSFGYSKPKHMKAIKNWSPVSLSLAPMYAQPMAGDDADLTHARACYHNGNPAPLRQYLADQAEAREACARAKLGL